MTIIRKADKNDAKKIVDINLMTWRSTYLGIVDEAVIDQREDERQERVERIQTRIEQDTVTELYVAEHKSEVVGFLSFGPSRETNKQFMNASEVYAIYIYEHLQKQGIGRKMIKRAVEVLHEKSYDQMIIWALKKNPNVQFYLKMGGQPLLKKSVKIGNKTYPEIGFVFDLELLKNQLEGA